MKRRLNTIKQCKGPHYRAFAWLNRNEIIIGDFDTIEEARAANAKFLANNPDAVIMIEALT